MNGACLVPRSGGESLNSELPKVVVEVLAGEPPPQLIDSRSESLQEPAQG